MTLSAYVKIDQRIDPEVFDKDLMLLEIGGSIEL
jgi:hypothetical protein